MTIPSKADIEKVVASLKRLGTRKTLDDMSRYGIPPDNAFGVTVGQIQKVAKPLGKNHELALALWETGWYEARLLASYVGEPARVTSAQMDRWCRDFDNWGVCDTVCFVLFDKSPHAWSRVAAWARRRAEFEKRAAFALLWGLTVHDKMSGDAPFVRCLPLIERAASDERHFVKKAVNMALRATGKRSAGLNAAAVEVAQRLAESSNESARWVGKDALRELGSASVMRRLAGKKR